MPHLHNDPNLSKPTIGVIGAGAWGTALAYAIARSGLPVVLWARREMALSNCPEHITLTTNPADLASVSIALMVVPAQVTRDVCALFAPVLSQNTAVIACAKGIEQETGLYMTQVIAQVLPHVQTAILSGPGFAEDVIAGLPTAVTLAASEMQRAETLAKTLSSSYLRLYHTDDVRGVEIGGAAKNVLAIAAGIVTGKGLGESARAALIARGFAELIRFATLSGARMETLIGLSGLGDLVLTCNSEKSRNYALGLALGQGHALQDASKGKLVEGVYTATILHRQAKAIGVDMPIVAAVDAVLSRQWPLDEAVRTLMSRPQKAEF
jgi:glycerol-3-phosphate dehydrogenase (NAD(P)+)